MKSFQVIEKDDGTRTATLDIYDEKGERTSHEDVEWSDIEARFSEEFPERVAEPESDDDGFEMPTKKATKGGKH